MAANKKPKKQYRPKPIIKDPITFVMVGNRPGTDEAQLKLKISYHLAMTNITQGRGQKEDWQEIANSINLAIVLAEMGWGKDYVPELAKAQGAMILLRDRLKQNGRIVVRAEEMNLINDALAIHDEQIAIAPIRDVDAAVRHIEQQFARGNFVTLSDLRKQGHEITS